ncbi:MAG: O-fucosyltransferase family protein [Rhizomicrobium sp.]
MDVNQEIRRARRALAVGQWTVSELTCRHILAENPDCVAAYELLATIAAGAGATEQVIGFLDSADSNRLVNRRLLQRLIFPGKIARQRQALERVAESRRADAVAAKRYLVIKSWGFGFWSEVSHTLGGLLLAEVTRRTPIVHWGKNYRFGDGSARDAFQDYFEPVSAESVPDITHIDRASFFPPKWTKANLTEEVVSKWTGRGSRLGAVEFLNREATVAVVDYYVGVAHVAAWLPMSHSLHGKPLGDILNYLAKKYLRPRPVIISRCNSFYREMLAGAPYVAVHIRGADKAVEETDLHATNRKILAALDSIPDEFRIFLLTDDVHYLSVMKGRYGERVVATECQRTDTATGTHYLPSTDRQRAGLEVMTDVYLALRADKFIGNGRSNVAALISVMRDWRPDDCTLLGTSELTNLRLRAYRDLRADPFVCT